MHFSDDFNYINSIEKELIKRGYGNLTVHSLHFDRFVSDEEKEEGRKLYNEQPERWSDHCDEVWSAWSEKAVTMMDALAANYSIYQYGDNNIKFGEQDLFFWSNKGWNNQDYMTGFSLTFNDEKSVEYNMTLLNDLKLFLSDHPGCFTCRIQYDAKIDYKQVENYVKDNIKKVQNKMITYGIMEGKIRWVDCNNEYGFFKKGAKSHYYRLSTTELFGIINAA